jgi:molybdopterin/thiamine biosynthesis adenylyltransferase
VLKELENLEDLRRLVEKRYSLSIISVHVVVNDVYYLDAQGLCQKGRLAAPLNQPTPETLGPPHNHQMYWSGSQPYYLDGSAIPLGKGGDVNVPLGDTTYTRNLSSKPLPTTSYATYSEMIEHYVALISAPAQSKYKVTPLTGTVYDVPEDISPFKIQDTFSAKAEILDLNLLVAKDRIAIIGLGGTGSFVLDFLVKTPVEAIDAYDFDVFAVHNGFRSPGEVPFGDFGKPKTEIYRHKYEPFRHRISFHNMRISKGNEAMFANTTFAFVCIDDGESRSEICEMLISLGIQFIDTGMGIEKEAAGLDGLIRTTMFTRGSAPAAIKEVPIDQHDENNIYRVFVQIAELNALNAALAVIRYKQLRGFYYDEHHYYQSFISLGSSNWIGKSMKYNVLEVGQFPDLFEPEILYWSKKFKISAHLCACGCGDVIYLPVDPANYSIRIDKGGPTLRPSVGNWNVCNAHYLITNGKVQWASKLTPEQIATGRASEDARRDAYYSSRNRSLRQVLLDWVRRLLHALGIDRQ